MSKYVISSSPHLRDNVSTTSIMRDVCIALLPAAVAGVLFFGYRSAIILALSVAAAVLSEWLYCKAAHCRNTIGDFSAVVTGMLLAMNLPSHRAVLDAGDRFCHRHPAVQDDLRRYRPELHQPGARRAQFWRCPGRA